MSTPPIAKEPEVTDRERVIAAFQSAIGDALSMNNPCDVDVHFIEEVDLTIADARIVLVALLESEQGEPEYDPWDHRKRCDVTEDPSGIGMSCQLPKGHTCDHVWFGYAKSGVDGSPERWAILGTESENGEDDGD